MLLHTLHGRWREGPETVFCYFFFFFGIYFCIEKGVYRNAQLWLKALAAIKAVDHFLFCCHSWTFTEPTERTVANIL